MHRTSATTCAGAPPAHEAGDYLLAQLLAAPPAPPWMRPARLRVTKAACLTTPPWVTTRPAAGRPLAVAATLLLAGGVMAASVGVAPALAEGRGPVAPQALSAAPAAAPFAEARLAGALAIRQVASARDVALLAGLLAKPAAGAGTAAPAPRASADTALLAALLASEPAAGASAAPAPAVSFTTVARLPDAALATAPAGVAAQQLPMITLAQNIIPPPAPPAWLNTQAQQQPPAPAGYVQPPGYQDGVPFGGQIGAVPRTAAARPAARPSSVIVTATYVVQPGDTLASIALRFYGTARQAPLIWETNYRLIGSNPNQIIPGQRLTLPGLTVRVTTTSAALPARGAIAAPSNYTIQPRDFLRWMAQRAYGNEMRWREIYNANRNVLGPNPDLIYPGVTVYIP